MFWVIVILTGLVAAAGFAIYRTDQKVKAKYEKKFNPNEWQLPSHIELPTVVDAHVKLEPQVRSLSSSDSVKITYEIKSSVYSGAQQNFYKAMDAALAGEFNILMNVHVTDVLAVVASNVLATQVALNNLTDKFFAFVICDKVQLHALCVIDWGNIIDNQLKMACESAQLPLLNVNTQAHYDVQLLREKILNIISSGKPSTIIKIESVLNIVDSKSTSQSNSHGIDLKFCPECSAVMIKRKAKNGEDAGKLFWLCSTYPKCRGMRAIK